ncbi:MAG: precorrin-2 C(20)-methyltransferase [Planctomycetes bacterium]|nr:precorrin-2 C(20)-methyltransferase [Planctomycetota bacterium]
MASGVLYGIGVGPGDPGLMTLKAVETIRRCRVVASPRTQNGGMVALDIAAGAVDMAGKKIVPLDFAMTRDAAQRAGMHLAGAAALRAELDAGESVALLNLGDISIYASFRYIADILGPEGYRIEMIPGVTSFCAAASALGVSLTDMNAPLRIIPEGMGITDDLLEGDGTLVLMKSGKQLPRLLAQLDARGLMDRTKVVQNCGMADQRLYPNPAATGIPDDYFTVVLVLPPSREEQR